MGVVSAFVSRLFYLIQQLVQLFLEEKGTSRLFVPSYELTFCGLIAERFVFEEMCSDRGYTPPLDGESRSWELIMRCVFNEKNIKNQGTCRRNFNFKRHVWPLQNSSSIPRGLKRKFSILFVFCQFTKMIKPTPTYLRQATSTLRRLYQSISRTNRPMKTSSLTERFETNQSQLTKNLHIRTQILF